MSRIPRWAGHGATARLVFSRLDGTLDVSDIAALTGLTEDVVEKTLEPLLSSGLLAFAEPPPAAPTASSAPPASAAPAPPAAAAPPVAAAPPAAPPAPVVGNGTPAMSDEEQQRIQELYAKLDRIDHYRLLGVAATADVKEIKRAYFALAKLYHPDRFFRKDVGPLQKKIEAIFAAMSNALECLTNAAQRAEYDAYLREVLKTRITRRNAEALEAKKDFAAAAEVWARVVESVPTEAYVQHRYAYALLRARTSLDQAIAAAARAIELDPSRAEYRVTAASLYLATGRERSALAELEAACELEGDRLDIAGMHAAIAERVQRTRASLVDSGA